MNSISTKLSILRTFRSLNSKRIPTSLIKDLQSSQQPTINGSTLVRTFCSKQIPKNVIEGLQSSQDQSENGVVYEKKPFKMNLTEGKNFSWCLCGRSKSQPFCDGTHKFVHYKIKQRPVRFQVEKDGDYYLCNCKQTKNRPYCDGTHKTLA